MHGGWGGGEDGLLHRPPWDDDDNLVQSGAGHRRSSCMSSGRRSGALPSFWAYESEACRQPISSSFAELKMLWFCRGKVSHRAGLGIQVGLTPKTALGRILNSCSDRSCSPGLWGRSPWVRPCHFLTEGPGQAMGLSVPHWSKVTLTGTSSQGCWKGK